jgi:hypothetical protein
MRRNAAVLGGYVALAFLYFGVRLLPHPGRYLLGYGADPDIFVWNFAWWPHALLHGQNPIVSHAVWAPDGINLAWVTSVPGLALLFAPVTLAFGPAVAYNLAAMLMPALAAFTAFLLCRHLTRAFWPSVAGGYLFGFSSYMLGQLLGHMHMTAVFLVPLVALAVVRFVQGELGPRGLAWRLGLLLALQFSFSTELYFTVTFALVVTALLAYAVVPAARARLRALPVPVLGGYALSAVLVSPLLWYALTDFETGTVNSPKPYSADVLNLVVPTRLVSVGNGLAAGLVERFPGNDAERGAYLGVPMLIVLAWFLWRRRRTPAGRLLGLALALGFALELGTALWIGGHRVVTLPWELVARLPLFNNVLPVRFSLFVSLAAAVAVALWAASRDVPRWARLVLPLAAVLSLVPTLRQADWKLHPNRPAFFAQPTLLADCVPKGENVLVFPFGAREHAMLWQAESGFRYRMAEGYLRPDTPPGFDYPAVRKLNQGEQDPTLAEILELARDKGVGRILSLEAYQHPSAKQLMRRFPTQVIGGVIVAPACGYPGIADSSRSSSS